MSGYASVYGRHPLHAVPPGYPLLTRCGQPVVANMVRKIRLNLFRQDLCRRCFPAPERPKRPRRTAGPKLIRLGRHQRTLVRRALNSRVSTVYPVGKREAEAVSALVNRRLFVPAPGLPGAYRIASPTVAIHLNGAVLQHGKD